MGVTKWRDDDIIKVDKINKGHTPPPRSRKPNSVFQHEKNGRVANRIYYDNRGYIKKGIDFTDHGRPDKHPYGKCGEHAHDYEWTDDGKSISRTTRELTDVERKGNRDLLWDIHYQHYSII